MESEKNQLNHEFINFTNETYELYDRNIRLWGKNNQLKLLNSKILLINLNPYITELAKNLILAGTSLILFDPLLFHDQYSDNLISKCDVDYNFLIEQNDFGKRRNEILREKLLKINQNISIEIITKINYDPNSFRTCVYGYKNSKEYYFYFQNFTQKNFQFFSLFAYDIYGFSLNNIHILKSHLESDIYNMLKPIIYYIIDNVSNNRDEVNQKKIRKIVPILSFLLCLIWNSNILSQQTNNHEKLQEIKSIKILIEKYNKLNVDSTKTDEVEMSDNIDLERNISEHLRYFTKKQENPENYSEYEILTGNVIAGVVTQDILNLITESDKNISNIIHYDSYLQNSDSIDLLTYLIKKNEKPGNEIVIFDD